jgi:membrane protease YdiL (CAAX protease family)
MPRPGKSAEVSDSPVRPVLSLGGSKLPVIWLLVVFCLGVGLRFVPSQQSEPPGPSMLFSERLVLLARFGDLSPELGSQLLRTAELWEQDEPARLAVLQGREPSLEEAEKLPAGYRLLASHQARPSPTTEQQLRERAREAWHRFRLCLLLLSALVGSALLMALAGRTERSREVQPMTRLSPLGFLALFMAWDVANVFGLSVLISGLGLRQTLSPFALVMLFQLAVYGLLLGLLRWVRPSSWNLAYPFPVAWTGRGYFACYGLVLAINALIAGVSGHSPVSSNPLLSLFMQSAPWQVACLALLVVVVGPAFEELVFRGWLLGGMRQQWGDGRALLISSALFAAIHGDPWATPALFLLGLVFGWVYLRSGSLYASIIVHAMWNATTFTFLLANMP